MPEMIIVRIKFFSDRDGETRANYKGLEVYPQDFEERGFVEVLLTKVTPLNQIPYWLAHRVENIEPAFAALQRQPELEKQVQELNGEKDELRSRVETLTTLSDATAHSLQTAHNEIKALKEEKASLDAKCRACEERCARAQAEAEALRGELQAERARRDALQERMQVEETRSQQTAQKLLEEIAQTAKLRAELESKKLINRFKALFDPNSWRQ